MVIRRISGAADSCAEVRVIGGEPDDLRCHARRLHCWADSVDDEAVLLGRGVDVEWRSIAGDGFRRRIEADVRLLRAVAERIREAGDRFDHLADTLEQRQRWLEEAR